MNRSKRKGTAFEQQVCDWLNEELGTDEFHRLALGGANDVGDVYGLRAHGGKVVVECKACARTELAQWLGEAERERLNADALAKVVLVKRRGCGYARLGKTYAVMELDDLLAICAGREYGSE